MRMDEPNIFYPSNLQVDSPLLSEDLDLLTEEEISVRADNKLLSELPKGGFSMTRAVQEIAPSEQSLGTCHELRENS